MGLISISKAKFNRTTRNKRCRVIGRTEGGVTFQCGKQIVSHDVDSHLYYKLTGVDAINAGYSAKRHRKIRGY